MTHDDRHDEVLALLLAGDVGEDAPAARAQLDGCAHCRERWSGLSRLATRIDELEADRRAVLAEASRRTRTPDTSRIVTQLAELRASTRVAEAPRAAGAEQTRAGQAPRRPAIGRWVAALAACAAVVLVYQQFARRRANGYDQFLGAGSLEGIVPRGRVSVFDRFEWSYPLDDGDRCELVVVDAKSTVLAERTVRANRVEFSLDTTSAWPDEIQWRVTVVPAGGGDVVSSPLYDARRSP